MKITGIGNALLDVLIQLNNEDIIQHIGMKKGAMDLIDEFTMQEIQRIGKGLPRSVTPGGSVCNTMRALARLGATVGYIGKTGSDEAGKIYEAETVKAGVNPFFAHAEGISGCSTVLVSPDGERTMATFLGPAATLTADEIPDEAISSYDIIYMEGYLISNEKLFLPMLKRAKTAGLKIALDLSNFNIVTGFRSLLQTVIPEYVNILFANESEAEAYTGRPAREAINIIAREVDIAVVTTGKDGALAASGEKVIHEAAAGSRVVDTTGAGDHFAAGFLYGYISGATLEKSAWTGSLLSANVIDTLGAQIPDERWNDIQSRIKNHELRDKN